MIIFKNRYSTALNDNIKKFFNSPKYFPPILLNVVSESDAVRKKSGKINHFMPQKFKQIINLLYLRKFSACNL